MSTQQSKPDYSDFNEPYLHPGKFEGERMAVIYAYDEFMNGCSDGFGDVTTYGVYCSSVDLGEPIGTVYFYEDTLGFVHEISEDDYATAEVDYNTWCEQQEE